MPTHMLLTLRIWRRESERGLTLLVCGEPTACFSLMPTSLILCYGLDCVRSPPQTHTHNPYVEVLTPQNLRI